MCKLQQLAEGTVDLNPREDPRVHPWWLVDTRLWSPRVGEPREKLD